MPHLNPRKHRFVVIGCGSSSSLPWFRELTGYDQELYVDPRDCASYRVLGLHRGVSWRVVTLRALCWTVYNMLFSRDLATADTQQQGGACVVRGLGGGRVEVLYSHREKDQTDHAPLPDIYRALLQ